MRPITIVLFGISLGITWDQFFIPAPPGITVPIFMTLVLMGYMLFARMFSRPTDAFTIMLSLTAFFFSMMVFVRESLPLTVLNFAAMFFALFLLASQATKKFQDFHLWDYLKLPFLPFKFLVPFFQTIGNLFSRPNTAQERNFLPHIIKGLLLAVPFFAIFLLLFISADQAFQKFLADIFDINLEALAHIIRSAMVAAVFIGAYAFIFLTPHPEHQHSEQKVFRPIGLIEGLTVLGVVNFLFAVFVSFQFVTLLRAGSNVPSLEITYAQYARNGFGQLIVAAAISFVLLWALESTITRRDTHASGFKMLSSMMVFLIALIMTSAFFRLWFYEQEYGFTHLRLYSHIFILWLAVIFIFLLYKIFADHRDTIFLLPTVLSILSPSRPSIS